jgi:pilus assembly protein Flp/PilA
MWGVEKEGVSPMKRLVTRVLPGGTSRIGAFLRDESGSNAIEYGLIAALVSIVMVAALTAIGSKLNTTFTSVGSALGSN